ncbi:MAG: type I-E CRISPR-associated protein Cas5/CasD [Ruminococcus sp.]|nr:type I-E CRISPR-associated protein Cas5/CasD [Ruminococcus sp.]
MATLLLRLAAPLQAWGSGSKFNIRTTEREPTKSGVIGMIAAAMGIQREDSEGLAPLTALKFGVRVEKEGKLLKDFHMVHEMTGKKASHVTERYYLSDAVFIAALSSEDKALLEKIEQAVKAPVYPLFLGRRSCPPTLPVVLGLRDSGLEDALRAEPSLSGANGSKRIVLDSENGGTAVFDVPVSFSQRHRQYAPRFKREEQLPGSEHDPMSEL